jgi:hypothetical protein
MFAARHEDHAAPTRGDVIDGVLQRARSVPRVRQAHELLTDRTLDFFATRRAGTRTPE